MKAIYVALITGFMLITSAVSYTWASGNLPPENPLGDDFYNKTFFPRIDFTDIRLEYAKKHIKKYGHNDNGKGVKKGFSHANPGTFNATSTKISSFTLVSPSLEETNYNGYFSLSSNITREGELIDGWFSFTSDDPIFGFGTEEVCNKKGKHCRIMPVSGDVFSGLLTDFGWSLSKGMLEFATTDFTGWACEMGWCSDNERIWFDIQGGAQGLLEGFQNKNKWSAMADGTAVIPVPAAAWLFGSGLIGLVAIARHRNNKTS